MAATFTRMDESTAEQWAVIGQETNANQGRVAERVLMLLRSLADITDGFSTDQLTHCLQTATLAQQAGADDEVVVSALLHDIGDTLGVYNHPDIAAAILRPFVSEANHWMVANHGIFQGYYFFHHLGLDREMREQYRGHPHFEYCAQFCHLFDQPAFDGAYDTMPLDAFVPMMHRVLDKPKQSIYLRKGSEQTAW